MDIKDGVSMQDMQALADENKAMENQAEAGPADDAKTGIAA